MNSSFLVRALPVGLVPEGETPSVEDYAAAAVNFVVNAPNHGDALHIFGRVYSSKWAFPIAQEIRAFL